MTALSIRSCDLNAQASPTLQRCVPPLVQGDLLTGDFSIFIANFSFLSGNRLSLRIPSQVVHVPSR
jgi:hypothetical protein